MDDKDTMLAFALVSAMGLIARGATPAEVRDMAWVYAQFAMNGKPENENQ
jgi:hypothetical protein